MTASTIERKAPPLGGFNLTFLGLEVRRMLRNKRTLIFTLVMPLIFFFLIGKPQRSSTIPGTSVNGMEYAMISFALYGAMTMRGHLSDVRRRGARLAQPSAA